MAAASDEEDHGRGWEMILPGTTAVYADVEDDFFSVFPPSLHEGLTPTPSLDSSPSSDSYDSTVLSHESAEGLEEKPKEDEVGKEELTNPVILRPISESARRLVEYGSELVRLKISENGGAVWSFAAIACLAGALIYRRRQHRREKELLLFSISEKDQKINQLMHQIVQLSEVITAHYMVPVLKSS